MKKLLLITSSGGGGLIQTANAKAQEALAKYPDLTIVRKDLSTDWIPFGSSFVNIWNKAQKKGNIAAQMFCVKGQFVWDYMIYPVIFCQALYTLFKEDVDYIIDTQPLGTSAILRALRIFNRKRNRKVRLEKVLVDLPTKKATHFFRSIKKLSNRHRKLITLTSIQPLLEEGETAEQFWQETCGFSEKEINLEEVYVRQAFRSYRGKARTSEPMHIKIRYKINEELTLMKKSFERGSIRAILRDGEVDFWIMPEDRVITILLGSQPAFNATLNYAANFVEIAREHPEVPMHIFVFCADHKAGEQTLFSALAEQTRSIKDYPKNLSIIPFCFQKEDVIAPLFYRSDATCTRSGGQTAMELMCVSTGEIWIHSEAKKDQEMIEGIPGWEAASALYLQKLHGAKIVTPETFGLQAKQILQNSNSQVV